MWKRQLYDVDGEVVGTTHRGKEPTDHWIFQAVPQNLSVITVCFRSLHENIAWFALHVSRPYSDDQTLCGWLAQFALITSFSRSHDERAEDSVVSPLFNKVLREEGDEWKCHCNRRLGHTLQRLLQSVCVCVGVHAEGQRPLSKSCIWSYQQGQTLRRALALAHAQLSVPQTGATHVPEINQTSSSPVTTSEQPPPVFTILPHTLLWGFIEIIAQTWNKTSPKWCNNWEFCGYFKKKKRCVHPV